MNTPTNDNAGECSPASPCSTFIDWADKAGYLTCTSDIQIALEEAWNAGVETKGGDMLKSIHEWERYSDGLHRDLNRAAIKNATLQNALDCCLGCLKSHHMTKKGISTLVRKTEDILSNVSHHLQPESEAKGC
jgi:hypothetical protein